MIQSPHLVSQCSQLLLPDAFPSLHLSQHPGVHSDDVGHIGDDMICLHLPILTTFRPTAASHWWWLWQLWHPPQPWTARDHLLNSVHAQLVAPQDSNLLDVFQSIPAKEQKMLDVNDVAPHLASTFDTIWSLNQAVEPNWTLFRFSALTYQSDIDISN